MDQADQRLDQLTGLPTLKALDDVIASSKGTSLAAVFFDIDGFRFVTCERGYLVGDDVLVQLGAWLAEQARALRGQAFRVAGDKFVLLLPERTIAEAAETANTIVASCPSLPLPHAITLSAIVFAIGSEWHGSSREMIEKFGHELYRAELASGRDTGNVVVLESPAV